MCPILGSAKLKVRVDRHAQSRLKREQVIWLVTASRDGHPQAVPVWFLWDGSSFLIYAQPGIKVRHVQENPLVELHLNSDEAGNDVVRVSGQASIPKRFPSAARSSAYLRKYRRAILDLGMTVEQFAESYRHPIVVRRLKYH
jgi:PPOX class probable F420-dependent enzyme